VRRLLVLMAIALALALAAGPAAAVTYGEPDGNAHPYVGLVVFYDEDGEPMHRCSGTLLSATVFLTAGHCTFGATSAQVWFDPVVTTESGYPFTGGVTGTPYTHPGYDEFATFPNTSDLGIVVLDRRVKLSTYGRLPSLGFLDSLATKRGQQAITFTVVGYGLQEVKPNFSALRERFRASQQLTDLRSALTDGYNLRATNAPGEGTGDGQTPAGGTCFGDSGGPVFYGNTNIIVGVTSFGLNENCKGGDYAYRTDIANAQNFIYSFLR
jgi:secreted trypsin-like serine protease